MSLKAFHLFFIALSIVLAAFVTAWAVSQYQARHDVDFALAGLVSAAVGAGLAVYGAAFQRKARRL
jgi:hypothetical protein